MRCHHTVNFSQYHLFGKMTFRIIQTFELQFVTRFNGSLLIKQLLICSFIIEISFEQINVLIPIIIKSSIQQFSLSPQLMQTLCTSLAFQNKYFNKNESLNMQTFKTERVNNSIPMTQNDKDSHFGSNDNEHKNYGHKININHLIEICTYKLESNPRHKKALYIRASSFMKKKKYQEAINDCHSILDIDCKNIGAYYLMGCAYEKIGQIQLAIQNLTIVIQLDPQHVNALLARGSCLNKVRNFKQALEDYENALKLDTQKSRFKKSYSETRRFGTQRNYSRKQSQQDLVKDHQNKLAPIELNTSNWVGSPALSHTQLIKRNSSSISLQKVSSIRKINSINDQKDTSLQELSFSQFGRNESENISKANFYYTEGLQARKQQNFKQAINFYKRALEWNPKHFKALFSCGVAFDKIGEIGKAVQFYTQALVLEPKSSFCEYNKGISLEKLGRTQEAIECFSRAIMIDSQKGEFYSNRGFALKKLRRYEEAATDYCKAISINPKNYKLYYYRAMCYEKLNMQKEEERDYLMALQLQPQNINCLYNLGLFYERKSYYEKAFNCFSDLLQQNSKFPPVYNALGIIYDKLQNYQKSCLEFTKAIELDPKNAIFYHNRGCCYKNMGKYDKSIQDFKQALAYDPSNTVAYSNIGIVYRKMEKFEQAIEYFSKEISLNGNSVQYSKSYAYRAYCYIRLGMYHQAIEDYTMALRAQPQNLQYLHNRGVCFERIHQYNKAVEDFTSQINLSQCPSSYFIRGYCYDSMGQLELAIKDYSEALKK